MLNRWGQQPKAAKWICSTVEYASVTLCAAAVVAAAATAKITTAETCRKQGVARKRK